MLRPPACPVCQNAKLPTVNLIGPKGIPLKLPNVLAVSGTEASFWDLVEKLRITPMLICPACGHTYAWTRA
jgi:hypothetical protein